MDYGQPTPDLLILNLPTQRKDPGACGRTRIWEQDLEHKEKRRQQDGDKDDLCPEGLIHEEECQDDADDV